MDFPFEVLMRGTFSICNDSGESNYGTCLAVSAIWQLEQKSKLPSMTHSNPPKRRLLPNSRLDQKESRINCRIHQKSKQNTTTQNSKMNAEVNDLRRYEDCISIFNYYFDAKELNKYRVMRTKQKKKKENTITSCTMN